MDAVHRQMDRIAEVPGSPMLLADVHAARDLRETPSVWEPGSSMRGPYSDSEQPLPRRSRSRRSSGGEDPAALADVRDRLVQ